MAEQNSLGSRPADTKRVVYWSSREEKSQEETVWSWRCVSAFDRQKKFGTEPPLLKKHQLFVSDFFYLFGECETRVGKNCSCSGQGNYGGTDQVWSQFSIFSLNFLCYFFMIYLSCLDAAKVSPHSFDFCAFLKASRESGTKLNQGHSWTRAF